MVSVSGSGAVPWLGLSATRVSGPHQQLHLASFHAVLEDLETDALSEVQQVCDGGVGVPDRSGGVCPLLVQFLQARLEVAVTGVAT